MGNELANTGSMALERLNNAGMEVDRVIERCLPISCGKTKNFCQSMMIAKGVHDLKQIMLSTPEIKQVVMSMINNRLGFLTDRTPAVLWRNQQNGKGPTKPYSYEELVDPLAEGLLKGYRITSNEINIISGQFYAAKSGNYRLVVEQPGLSNFIYNNEPVQLSGNGQMARVKCWASWLLNGKRMSIGVEDGDALVLQIRVNAGMGEDGVIGKAHSKLFKRVLERITGQVSPEATDLGGEEIPDAEIAGESEASTDDAAVALKNKDTSLYSHPKGCNRAGAKDQGTANVDQLWESLRASVAEAGVNSPESWANIEAYIQHNVETTKKPVFEVLMAAVNTDPVDLMLTVTDWHSRTQQQADTQEREPAGASRYYGSNSRPPENTRLDGLPQWNDNHPLWPDKWGKMRTGDGVKTGLAAYVHQNESAIASMPEDIQRELVGRFGKLYKNMRFPFQLPWMASGAEAVGQEEPPVDPRPQDTEPCLGAEDMCRLRTMRIDLVAMKQDNPPIFKMAVDNLAHQGIIKSKIPAQMDANECEKVTAEIDNLKNNKF